MAQTPSGGARSNPVAITALVAGIFAVGFSVFVSIVVGGIFALVALLAGNFALQRARPGSSDRSLAIGGMVLAGISIAINIIVPNVLD